MERQSHSLFTNCPFETEIKSVGNYNPGMNIDARSGPVDINGGASAESWFLSALFSKDIFKAYIPWFLYKPPYGYPRSVNPLELRQFASNPYVFTAIKTIQDEVANADFDIVLKEDFKEEGYELDKEIKKQIMNFFKHPNSNTKETFRTLIKSWIKDMCEIGNCIGVKVFDHQGRFSQLVARDAATFLLNTDPYGMLGERADFVKSPTPDTLNENIPSNLAEQYAKVQTAQQLGQINKLYKDDKILAESYDTMYSQNAAYFQYGWTAGARPVPFGTREIIWIEMNSRSNNIYPQSPIEVLWNTILTLVYGIEYNLDFYLNNNLPNGLLYFEGMPQTQAEGYRAQMARIFMERDEYGNQKKQHFKVPVSGYKPEFIPMQMTSKEMEVIEQQKWFAKQLWMCFGLNESEVGVMEDVNKSNGEVQKSNIVRKITKPYLNAIEDAINNQLMPEFGHPELEFKFDEYSTEDEKARLDIYEQQIRMGIKTPKMVAEELGVNLEKLDETKVEDKEFENKYNQDNKFEQKSTPFENVRQIAETYGISYNLLKKGMEREKILPGECQKIIEVVIVNLRKDPDYYK